MRLRNDYSFYHVADNLIRQQDYRQSEAIRNIERVYGQVEHLLG